MEREDLIAAIKKHLRRTRESAYAFGRRVMNDQTFLWKLQTQGRNPRPATAKKVMMAISRREASMKAQRAKYGRVIGW